MPVVAADLVRYSSANEVTDDTSTVGGAIVTTSRPELTQLSANAVIAAISDGADTRNLTVIARKADGTLVTETKALTGAVEILFNVNGTVERIESVDDNVSPTMPTGSLAAAGGYVGVWINQSLPSNDVAQKSTYTLTVTGLTT
jgi:hypothetical protein